MISRWKEECCVQVQVQFKETKPLIQTPKRTLTENIIFVGSPDKGRKLSFKENFEFWKIQRDNTYTQCVPTNSALRYFSNNGWADKRADQ